MKASGRQSRGELLTLRQGLRTLAGLDFFEPFDDVKTLGLCEADDSFALAFEAEPGLTLPIGGDADVGDDRFRA